jgi:hypothetical protein
LFAALDIQFFIAQECFMQSEREQAALESAAYGSKAGRGDFLKYGHQKAQ